MLIDVNRIVISRNIVYKNKAKYL